MMQLRGQIGKDIRRGITANRLRKRFDQRRRCREKLLDSRIRSRIASDL
jgi:hypothetical protein